jgi:hypothetical protein
MTVVASYQRRTLTTITRQLGGQILVRRNVKRRICREEIGRFDLKLMDFDRPDKEDVSKSGIESIGD